MVTGIEVFLFEGGNVFFDLCLGFNGESERQKFTAVVFVAALGRQRNAFVRIRRRFFEGTHINV